MKNNNEALTSDNEFYDYIRNNQTDNFRARINAAYASTLRFTNYRWTCLHLAIFYRRIEIINSILETDSSASFINTRDINGETALHIAAYNDDILTSVKLLNRGASYNSKNNLSQDPIDIIPTYEKRKNYINKMLSYSDKLVNKEISIIKRHKYQLQYILSLYEIIECTSNKTNFEYFRKGYFESETKNMNMIDTDFKRDVEQFCLNFRPYEEFYDMNITSTIERQRKMKIYGMNTTNNTDMTSNTLKDNKKKMEYSMYLNNNNDTVEAMDTFANVNKEKDKTVNREEVDVYALEPVVSMIKPYSNVSQVKDTENRLRQTDFDRLY